MRYLYIILLLVLLSSCNLFRKVSKETTKSKESSEIVQKTETRAQEVIKEQVHNNIRTNKIINSEGVTIAYGKDLTVNPDGSISGADSVKRFHNNSSDENTEDLSVRNTESTKDSMGISENKKTNKKLDQGSNTQSTTDWKLYVFIFVLLGVVGILLWLKFK